MGLLLAHVELANLRVDDHTNDRAVLLDALKVFLDVGEVLGLLVVLLVSVLGEGLLLGLVPVLVEAALHLIAEVLGPNSGKGAKTTGSLDVANEANNDDRGALKNGNGLNDLLLVELAARLVNVTGDVGHASLVAEEGGKVARLGGIIPGEGLALANVVVGALAGAKAKGPVTGSFELAMRHAH
jgi:hypothetical protein